MTLQEFKTSLSSSTPPQNISEYLKALWFDAKGDWDKAHNIVQDIHSNNGSWIHAYLHRKEGDISNADYWYSRAGKKRPAASLEKEWDEIVVAFLS